MTITVICPNLCCRSVLRVPEEVRGQKVRCGKCGKNFIVPDKTARAAQVPASPSSPASGKSSE